jgi:hypothetical protein
VIIGRLQFRSDKNEGGDSWGEGDPEHDTKLNETRHKTSKMNLAQNLFSIWIGFDLDNNISTRYNFRKIPAWVTERLKDRSSACQSGL